MQVQVRPVSYQGGNPSFVLTAILQMLSRHGSRYPTLGINVQQFGDRMADAKGAFEASGALAFLNNWTYQLGAEILVPKGTLEVQWNPSMVITWLT